MHQPETWGQCVGIPRRPGNSCSRTHPGCPIEIAALGTRIGPSGWLNFPRAPGGRGTPISSVPPIASDPAQSCSYRHHTACCDGSDSWAEPCRSGDGQSGLLGRDSSAYRKLGWSPSPHLGASEGDPVKSRGLNADTVELTCDRLALQLRWLEIVCLCLVVVLLENGR